MDIVPDHACPTGLSTSSDSEEDKGEEENARFNTFDSLSKQKQSKLVETLLLRMSNSQHVCIDGIIKQMLQRDFIESLSQKGLDHITEKIFLYLDGDSIRESEVVSKTWYHTISECAIWKKKIKQMIEKDPWKGVVERRGWKISKNTRFDQHQHPYFRSLYKKITEDTERLERNWTYGNYGLLRIHCLGENIKGVYCLQYDEEKIVSGLRDNTIKFWDKKTLQCTGVLNGHTGSVLCLQYDDKILVSGSSDATIRIWNIESGELLNTLIHHHEAVLHLRLQDTTLISCSKDRSIAVWDFMSPTEVGLRRVLEGHRAAVNVIDFDEKFIVSASGDRTIKVWDTATCEYLKTLNGHRRGIACLQYTSNLVASGSSDYTIRLWNVEPGCCLRVLEGHEDLVRCIRFDNKYIISGAYDGTIKVWDLQAALDPQTSSRALCIQTLMEHTGRVFRVQFDDFQIVSSSHDDTILIWDFLDDETTYSGHNSIFRENYERPNRTHNDSTSTGSVTDDEQ